MNSRERILYMLLSLAVAAVAWYYVATAQNPQVERTITVDLHVRGLSPNEVLVDPPPPTVRVQLSGTRSLMFGLTPGQLDASIDLAEQQPGEHRQPVIVTAPPEVRVVAQVPREVVVRLDTVQTQRFPVEISLIGTLPQGVTLGPPRVTPAYVTVIGAASQIEEIRHAVVTVDTSNLPQHAASTLQVRLLDANGQEVRGPTINPPIVTAQLTVKESVIAKVVPVVPQIAATPPPPLAVTSITADPGTVTLQGPAVRLQDVTAVSTAPVDLHSAKGDVKAPVGLQIPSGVTASVSRVTVSVKIGGGSLSTIIHSVPVQIIGLRRGVRPRVVPSSIDIQVEGPTSIVSHLTAASIRVVVDAGGRGAGKYQVTPLAELPRGVHVLNLHPTQVTVILTSS